jgi:predicted Zn-dependent protease with MMP-like domain
MTRMDTPEFEDGPVPIISWNELLALAGAEVNATLQALPKALRTQAQRLPITFEPCPSAELVDDGLDPDTLGIFVGEAYPDSELPGLPLPPQIILFLENIWEFADGNRRDYATEVRTTLLHELGHYLGLSESDLEARDLD